MAGIVSPLAPGAVYERVDQGVDYEQGSPYRALAAGTITAIGGFGGGSDTSVYETLDAPIAGFTEVYYAETSPLVHVGQRVQAGQAVTGPGAAELGFASGNEPAAPLVGGLGAGTQPTTPGYTFLELVDPARAKTLGVPSSPSPGSSGGVTGALEHVGGSVLNTATGGVSGVVSSAGGVVNDALTYVVPGLSAVENLPGDVGKAVSGVATWLEYEVPLLGLYGGLTLLAFVLILLGANRAAGGAPGRAARGAARGAATAAAAA